ncbi:acyl carrier protein [Streptomyces fumanus]|uniref:acyl carrier protein n=1 Tax=Streptomyces fumanus TaxID=67302 RepID=UPI0033CA5496
MSREALLRELALMSPEEALARTTGHLVGTLAEVTRMDPDQIDPHQRVDGYGLDSLMATTELLLTLQARYEVEIPPMEPLRSATGTLADTARLVHLRLGPAGGTTPPAPALPAPRRNSTSQPGESRVPHQDGTGHETTTAGRRPPPVR